MPVVSARLRRAVPSVIAVLLLLVTALAVPIAAAQSAAGPETAVVDTLHRGLVDIMGAPPPGGPDARSAALGTLVKATFDIDAMGALAVGIRNFRAWTEDQRVTFLEAFARFMVATHSFRFEEARDQAFEIAGSEDAQAGRKLVHARYLRAGHDPVVVDYLVQDRTGEWRILDVYLDGSISLLALHRAEFSSVLRDRGFDGFIAALHTKADELNARRSVN